MADESKYPTRIAPYGLRIPPDLKSRVEAAAKANNRSMNAEIVATLEEKYPEAVDHPFMALLKLTKLVGNSPQEDLIKAARSLLSAPNAEFSDEDLWSTLLIIRGVDRLVGTDYTPDDLRSILQSSLERAPKQD